MIKEVLDICNGEGAWAVTINGGRRLTVEEVVMEYGDMLYRICVVMLCNEQDAQDAVQDTLCRYMEHTSGFCTRDHEKAADMMGNPGQPGQERGETGI